MTIDDQTPKEDPAMLKFYTLLDILHEEVTSLIKKNKEQENE